MKKVLVGVAVVAGLLAACGDSEKAAQKQKIQEEERIEGNMQYLARGFVKSALKDADSAEFRNQKGVCGEVNAKNSFGGYTGFKRFIAANKELVIMDGDPALAPGAFQEVWVKFCG